MHIMSLVQVIITHSQWDMRHIFNTTRSTYLSAHFLSHGYFQPFAKELGQLSSRADVTHSRTSKKHRYISAQNLIFTLHKMFIIVL